jgi:transposase
MSSTSNSPATRSPRLTRSIREYVADQTRTASLSKDTAGRSLKRDPDEDRKQTTTASQRYRSSADLLGERDEDALWTYRQGAAVTRFFSRWYAWAIRSQLDPVRKVARMLKSHLPGVLRFVKHPITNGVAEGLNSKIMSIKRKAGGFRNPQNFTTAIYFHCGGLDLYPR